VPCGVERTGAPSVAAGPRNIPPVRRDPAGSRLDGSMRLADRRSVLRVFLKGLGSCRCLAERMPKRHGPRQHLPRRRHRPGDQRPLEPGAQEARLVLQKCPGPVIELGPGTGPVTDALVRRGISPDRLVLVEYNPDLLEIVAQPGWSRRPASVSRRL
jgi:hypothetical protein